MNASTSIPITLFQQYYHTDDRDRQAELDYVISKNCKNKCFHRVILFSDVSFGLIPFELGEHVTLHPLSSRLTYADWLYHSFRLCPSGISLLANSDIMFDFSIRHIRTMQGQHCFAVITRYEDFTLADNPSLTQDAWAFVPARATIVNKSHLIHSSHIPLGYPGCENRMAAVAQEAGLRLINPCEYIHIHHIHRDQSRTYNEANRILGTYSFVHPGMIDQEATCNPDHICNLVSMESSCDRMVFDHLGLRSID